MKSAKVVRRNRIHNKIRAKMSGTKTRPRLVVTRTLNYNYAQLIDDESGKTIASFNDLKVKSGSRMERAAQVGKEIGQKAKEMEIDTCVFDRNGFKYHGRVKALAEGAREAGLKF